MKRMIQLVTERPKTVVAAILLLTVLAGVALVRPGLRMNADPYILNADHPSMVALEHLREEFTGTLETALVLLREEDGIINPDSLRRIGRLTTAFETMTLVQPGQAEKLARLGQGLTGEPRALLDDLLADGLTVDDGDPVLDLQGLLDPEDPALAPLFDALDETLLMLQPVKEVTSLANVENITARGDELVVDTLYEDVPTAPAALASVQRTALDNDLFRKVLLSPDGTSTGIIVETYIPRVRSDLMSQAHQRMLALLDEIPGDEEAHVAGMPIMAATSVSIMQRDNKMFFPLVFAIVLAVLAITFRGPAGVLLPISVVLISVTWTLGLMALFNVPLNIITTTLPVFLITIGVADGIHLVSEFRDHRRGGKSPREAAVATMRQLALPVLMTSITTSVGFFTLAYTHIRYIQHFGVFVGIGVLAAMVFSLTFIPAVLALGRNTPLAGGAAAAAGTGERGGWVARFDAAALRALVWVSRVAVRRRAWLLAGALAIMAVSVFGLLRVEVENNFVKYFRQDIPVVQAAYAINDHLAGSSVVNMIITAPEGEPDPFKSPRNLAAVEALQRHIEQNPIVGRTMGLTDVLRRMNLVLHQNDPAYNRLPREQETVLTAQGRQTIDGRNLVAQYLLLYENGGGSNLSDVTDSTYRTLNVQVQLNTISSQKIAALIDETQAYAMANLPPGLSMRFVGPAEAATTVNEEVVRTQVTSLAMSLVVVFLLLLVQFRSLSKGLLGIVPLVFTVLVNFGMMGLTGIPLNLGTAIISSVVIGIGVDFAIHYLSRLQTELDRGLAPGEAFAATMLASGKAITANAVTVAVGFLALSFSDMVPIRQIGWMVSQTLILSAVSTLVLVPAAASFFRVGFLRQAGSSPKLTGGLASAVASDR